jgi:Arc/MetJ-type ribon-helix-helix transcriptional regulator
METISLKVEDKMLKNMDKALTKYNFGTRTEFVRSAIRSKLEEYEKKELVSSFLNNKDNLKKVLKEDEVGKMLLYELEHKFE